MNCERMRLSKNQSGMLHMTMKVVHSNRSVQAKFKSSCRMVS